VRGSKTGTSTDASGAFRLSVPPGSNTLVITSVGFSRQEVDISDKSDISVSLVNANASLNEVVVTGYGTATKKNVTGAIASVQSKDFNKGVVTNPDQLLEGKVAGLQIINSSGQPWCRNRCKNQGAVTQSVAGNTPLIVLMEFLWMGGLQDQALIIIPD